MAAHERRPSCACQDARIITAGRQHAEGRDGQRDADTFLSILAAGQLLPRKREIGRAFPSRPGTWRPERGPIPGGGLKVTTTRLKAGYLRKNGVPLQRRTRR